MAMSSIVEGSGAGWGLPVRIGQDGADRGDRRNAAYCLWSGRARVGFEEQWRGARPAGQGIREGIRTIREVAGAERTQKGKDRRGRGRSAWLAIFPRQATVL
jgi:hypothetical protein